jgi:predicted CDP-diglyceride synthetase/phosphatidate cytidylyltransferase
VFGSFVSIIVISFIDILDQWVIGHFGGKFKIPNEMGVVKHVVGLVAGFLITSISIYLKPLLGTRTKNVSKICGMHCESWDEK